MSQPSSDPSPTAALLRMVVAIAVGAPLVAYLWETLHEILALKVDPGRLLASAGVLALFAALLAWMARGYGSGATGGEESDE